jgi:predicted nucleic acid-binding protein
VIVVDANVVAYAVLPGDRTDAALGAFEQDPEWIAPSLWRSEVRNVLATTMRVQGLSLADAMKAWQHASRLVLDAPLPGDTARILRLAENARASAYDCEYVALAEALGLAFVTGDGRLAKRFPDVAVSVTDFASA